MDDLVFDWDWYAPRGELRIDTYSMDNQQDTILVRCGFGGHVCLWVNKKDYHAPFTDEEIEALGPVLIDLVRMHTYELKHP